MMIIYIVIKNIIKIPPTTHTHTPQQEEIMAQNVFYHIQIFPSAGGIMSSPVKTLRDNVSLTDV